MEGAESTTVVLEKTLESPWTARRSNQSILKEISMDTFAICIFSTYLIPESEFSSFKMHMS